jgi:hypothetical protein
LLVFSHPRSGSTQLLNVLKRTISQTRAEDEIIILGEFFNVWNAGTFGKFSYLFYNLNFTPSNPIKGSCLVLSKTSNEYLDFYKDTKPNYYDSCKFLLKEINFEFATLDQLYELIAQELQNRLNFYCDLLANGYEPIVKHFFYLPMILDTDENKKISQIYEQFHSKLVKLDGLIFYRNDFTGSILSSFIKGFYYDLPAVLDKSFDQLVDSAHNFGNMPPLIPDADKIIDQNYFDMVINPFIEFLKFADTHTHFNTLTCDQLFSQTPVCLIYKDQQLLLKRYRSNNLEEEIPMNYSSDKFQYFKNSKDIPAMTDVYIKNNNLSTILTKLDITL